MANIDAQLKQSNGLVSLDDNNNSEAKVMRENGPPARIAPKDNIAALTSEMEKLSPGGSPVPPNTSATGSSSPTSSESTESFASLFKIFAKFGDSKSAGDAITLSNSDKWFKQAKIIDGKTITTTDTGIYFKQVAKTKKALSLKEYNQFLEKLATVKKIDLALIKGKLQSSGPPATNKTTTANTSAAFARLTDHTKYTGSHKQRFDESGKGRGKAGREDILPNTGYVTGFKA